MDLVIEIDITSPSLRKASIYAQIGVPEVWRYDGTTFRIDRLEATGYVSADSSPAFPILTVQVISDLQAQSRTSTRLNWLRSWREWIRERRDEA